MLRWPNVIGVGVGKKYRNGHPTDREAVVVLVARKLPESQLASYEVLPQSLGPGVLTDVIEVGEVKALMPSNEEVSFRHGRQRPAPGGVSIGHREVTAGTLGTVVRDVESDEPLILSNNHVLVSGRLAYGEHVPGDEDVILQPASYDGGHAPVDVIGYLRRFVPISLEERQAICPVAKRAERGINVLFRMLAPGYCVQLRRLGRGDNLVDAAVAAPAAGDLVSAEIRGIGEPTGTGSAEVGMQVRKSGRSSGLTEGEVTTVGASIKVKMGEGEEALFQEQIITDPMARPGDSGSVLVDEKNRIVGLLSAGSDRISIASRIDNVFDLLEIRL